MDQELKLILKLEGQDRLKALAGYVGDVNKALGDRERAEKQLVKALKDTATAEQLVHGEYQKEMTIIKNLRDVKSQATAAMESDNARMMKSYFSVGEELRRFYREQRVGDRTMRESTEAVRGFTSIIGGTEISNAFNTVVNNFQQTEFAVNAVGIAAQGAGGKIAAFAAKAVAIGGPVSIAVAAIYTMVKGFQEMEKAIADTIKKAEDFASKRLLESLTPDEKRIAAEDKLNKLLKERGAIRGTETNIGEALLTSGKSILEAAQKTTEARQKYADLTAQIEELRLELEKLPRINTLGVAAPWPEDVELVAEAAVTRSRGVSPGALSTIRARRGISGMNIPTALSGVQPMPSAWGRSKDVKVAFSELSTEARGAFVGIESMASAASSHIGNSITTALKGAFGEGENLFEDMLASFASSLADFGLKELFKSIFSFLPGGGIISQAFAGGGVITEPYVARGVHTGSVALFGERGPETIAPLNSIGGISHNASAGNMGQLADAVKGLTRTIARGGWNVRGQRLVFLQEQVSPSYQKVKL